LSKKIILIVFLVLIFFAGIIALTQEADDELPDIDSEEAEFSLDYEFDQDNDWIRPARWFRSNSGGMALEEMQSRFSALRNQYALAINYVSKDELPEYLFTYFDEEYNVEVRILYNKGEQIRAQWILRDEKGNTRLNAVFLEPEPEPEIIEKEHIFIKETVELITDNENETEAETENLARAEDEDEEEESQEEEKIVINKDIKKRRGFIEIFNEDLFLTSEYRFFEDGRTEKTEYELKNNLLLNAVYLMSDNAGDFKTYYTDYYHYNRSLSLRSIERIFQKDGMLDDPITIAFPRRIMDSIKKDIFISEKLNLYPEFFEDDFISAASKMIFNTDNRGRILGQTLYDEEDEIIWTIQNTWHGNRIVKTSKKEGDTVLTAEYAYNSGGDRILERDFRNGVLERVVSTKGDTEIEELYMNNAVVLRAVWEDGRKISETRVIN
jgi:hypothetical protein